MKRVLIGVLLNCFWFLGSWQVCAAIEGGTWEEVPQKDGYSFYADYQKGGFGYKIAKKGLYNYYIYYNAKGEQVFNSWVLEDGEWFYVGKEGYRYTGGVYFVNGKYYLFDGNGKWVSQKGEWKDQTELSNENEYCVLSDGTAAVNQYVMGKYYDKYGIHAIWDTNGPDGNMWVRQDGNWYIEHNGKRVVSNVARVGDKLYALDSQGVWINKEGWFQTCLKRWFYIGDDGIVKEGVQCIDGFLIAADGEYLPWEYGMDLKKEIDMVTELNKKGLTEIEKAKILFQYVVDNEDNIYYGDKEWCLKFNKGESVGGAYTGMGVCEFYAKQYQYLCDMVGIECIIVSSTATSHIWNEICIDGIWYEVDCAWGDFGGRQHVQIDSFKPFNIEATLQ